MLLAMDVGNSNIKMGIFSGDDLVQSFRVRTCLLYTSRCV